MLQVSCYGCMILTNWGKTNGAPAVRTFRCTAFRAPTRVSNVYSILSISIVCAAQQEGSGSDASAGNESMWLKIVSQWIFLVLYLRVLQVSYNNNA
jgi:hypothetical protein